jgi:formylglycine-generating enzyme required for sulfatase activity
MMATLLARSLQLVIVCAGLSVVPTAAADVAIDWITIGDPGNGCDTNAQGMLCTGTVNATYRISKFETTWAQYAEMLNAVAATDTFGLYNPSMADGGFYGGISRSGGPGTYVYNAIPGRENKTVVYHSFWDAARFANWLHNGQPTGVQDSTTTENGAYTLTPSAIANNTVTRNAEAKIFLPSEDEWHKAAYYNSATSSYFAYPAGSDAVISCGGPTSTPNYANCGQTVFDHQIVGSYTTSASPYGTFDQGGNVWEWIESTLIGSPLSRVMRGGSSFDPPSQLASSYRASADASTEFFAVVGFRVASSVPAVKVPALNPIGAGAIVLLMAGIGLRRLWSEPRLDSN